MIRIWSNIGLLKVTGHSNMATTTAEGSSQNAQVIATTMEGKIDHILALVSEIPSIKVDIAKLQVSLNTTDEKVSENTDRINNNEASLKYIDEDVCANKLEFQKLKDTVNFIGDKLNFIDALKLKMKELNTMITDLESYSRRENLIFDGIAETKGESCYNIVMDIMINTMGIRWASDYRIDRCHRLHPNYGYGGIKPIIVRFNFHQDRQCVWANRQRLKGSGIFLREDFPSIVDSRRKSMWPILKLAKETDKKAILIGDQLIYKQKRYTIETIPVELFRPDQGSRVEDKLLFFSGRTSFMSNFFPSPFMIDGMKYTHAEQFYQSQKAAYGGRADLAAQIVLEDEPIKQKRLGDSVKVNEDWYNSKAKKVMITALKAKFTQNPSLCKLMVKISEDGMQPIECNARDTFWSIGIPFTSKDLKNKATWKGHNMLGICLKEVSSYLLNEQLSKNDVTMVKS